MKINRKSLRRLIKEEIKILNEESGFNYNDVSGELLKILQQNLPEPYTVKIVGNEVIAYGIDGDGDASIEFKIIFP